MAISPVKKIELIGLEKQKGSIFELLQSLSMIEIIPPEKKEELFRTSQMHELDRFLLNLEEAVSWLNCFSEENSVFSSIVKLKPLVYQHELKKLLNEFNYKNKVEEVISLKNKLNSFQQEKQLVLHKKGLLFPWQKLNLSLDRIHVSSSCSFILGVVRKSEFDKLKITLEGETNNFFIDIVDKDKVNLYLSICCLKEEFVKIETGLKKNHFVFIALPAINGTIKMELVSLNERLHLVENEIKAIRNKLCALSKERFKLMVIYDYLSNQIARDSLAAETSRQRFIFHLTGWIRNVDIDIFKGSILKSFKNVAIFISEPSSKEKVPVALENKDILQPFEAVTDLYGRPLGNGVDPTGFLAPFFTIAFGFCLLDAGYGLILSILMLIFLKKKQLTKSTRNFLKLFLFMGFATIFAGLVTGSFFGDLISRLPESFGFLKKIQDSLKLFDPVKDSFLFLGLALVFGFIQMWTGIFIKFWNNLNRFRKRYEAFLCDLPTLLIQTSLALLVLVFTNIIPEFLLRYIIGILVLSSAAFIFYQWQSNNEMSLKVFWSIFGIYSIVTGNFLSDTLSFSRIFALGLTGTLLASAMNEMLFPKDATFGIVSFLTAIGALIVLLFVHFFIFAISMLGAYVHTSRLQYLEFFNNFFTPGGRPFRPFRQENRYTFLTEN